MSFLRIDGVTKRFGETAVVNGVSFAAERGEFIVFVGPSGCGKSTLLRMVAGLEEVSDGEIHLDGARVTDTPPAAREVAMVFQSYALYPHMTVRENMSFGLRMSGRKPAEIRALVEEAAASLQITNLLERKPRALSGGQRQRAAIGRAIVRHPKLFLFDEPLSNLDAELRTQMRVEIARLHRSLGVTMIYVTHDQVEAMTLADRIVVLRAGRVEQIGSPTELYDRPANLFVGGFIGSPKMNTLSVTVTEAGARTLTVQHPCFAAALTLPTRGTPASRPGDTVTLGLRPEHLDLAQNGAALLTLTGEFAESLGATSQLYTQAGPGETLVVAVPGRHPITQGTRLGITFAPEHAYLFDATGQAI